MVILLYSPVSPIHLVKTVRGHFKGRMSEIIKMQNNDNFTVPFGLQLHILVYLFCFFSLL